MNRKKSSANAFTESIWIDYNQTKHCTAPAALKGYTPIMAPTKILLSLNHASRVLLALPALEDSKTYK